MLPGGDHGDGDDGVAGLGLGLGRSLFVVEIQRDNMEKRSRKE